MEAEEETEQIREEADAKQHLLFRKVEVREEEEIGIGYVSHHKNI